MQAVAATAGARIVESNLQVIVPEEAVEGGPRLFPPAALSRGTISLQACRDGRASFHGLLVKARLFGCLGIEAVRTDRHEMTFHFTTLNGCQPVQRLKPGSDHLII